MNKMKGWKLPFFTMDGRLTLVKHVLSAMPIFQMIVMHMPIWLIKSIGKVRRGFLWEGKEITAGGKCLVNWSAICSPKDFGGLGFSNLIATSMALRARWLWQYWTDNNKPWQGLELPIDKKVRALFNASAIFHLGNGKKIIFWKDPWYNGVDLASAFPALFEHCTRKNLSVAEALRDQRWIRHLKRELT